MGWFEDNPPPPPTYKGSFDPLGRPVGLTSPYTPREWTGGDYTTLAKTGSLVDEFKQPTAEEVRATPGYQFTLNSGVRASDAGAATKGSLLSGGQLKALTRYGEDLGDTYYNQAFGRALSTRQQNRGEYDTDTNNAYRQYTTRYGVFNDARNADYGARQLNEGAYEFDANLNANSQNNRYRAWSDDLGNARNAFNDWWARGQDQVRNGMPKPPPG